MNINKYISALILSVVLMGSGCDSLLDFPPKGNDKLIEDVIKTEADVVKLLNGAYGAMADDNCMGGGFQGLAELSADLLDPSSLDENQRGVYFFTSSIFNGTSNNVYNQSYKAIRDANQVIEYLGLVSDENREQYEAEAMFLRGMIHFELNRMWGNPYKATSASTDLGIPIRLSTDASISPVRSTVSAVYAQVISDLKYAEEKLDAVVSRGVTDRFANKFAAKAYLARVYFQMNDFDNAFKYANDVLENASLELDTREDYYNHRFSPIVSTEEAFGLVSLYIEEGDFTRGKGGALKDKYRFDESNKPNFRLTNSFFNLATESVLDRRAAMYDSATVAGFKVISKYNDLKDEDGEKTLDKGKYMQVPLVHMTELLLIRAEASMLKSEKALDVAKADLKKIVDRAYGENGRVLPSADAELISEIQLQRRLELVTEGDYYHQLKRRGANGENLLIKGAPWDCPGALLQFPKVELDSNVDGFIGNDRGGC